MQSLLDDGYDMLQVLLGLSRFEAIGDGRLGVGGADERPAGREDNAHAVNLYQLIVLAEALLQLVYDTELDLFAHIGAALGCVEVLGHVLEALGDGGGAVAYRFEEAR